MALEKRLREHFNGPKEKNHPTEEFTEIIKG